MCACRSGVPERVYGSFAPTWFDGWSGGPSAHTATRQRCLREGAWPKLKVFICETEQPIFGIRMRPVNSFGRALTSAAVKVAETILAKRKAEVSLRRHFPSRHYEEVCFGDLIDYGGICTDKTHAAVLNTAFLASASMSKTCEPGM
jgi:hypothetical protein